MSQNNEYSIKSGKKWEKVGNNRIWIKYYCFLSSLVLRVCHEVRMQAVISLNNDQNRICCSNWMLGATKFPINFVSVCVLVLMFCSYSEDNNSWHSVTLKVIIKIVLNYWHSELRKRWQFLAWVWGVRRNSRWWTVLLWLIPSIL